jgi:hypothetical protein
MPSWCGSGGAPAGQTRFAGCCGTPDGPGSTCRSGRCWLGRHQCRESGIVDPPTWRSSQSLS